MRCDAARWRRRWVAPLPARLGRPGCGRRCRVQGERADRPARLQLLQRRHHARAVLRRGLSAGRLEIGEDSEVTEVLLGVASATVVDDERRERRRLTGRGVSPAPRLAPMHCSYFAAERCRSCTLIEQPYAEQLAAKQRHCQDVLCLLYTSDAADE